jgi:chemotaxis protein CheD
VTARPPAPCGLVAAPAAGDILPEAGGRSVYLFPGQVMVAAQDCRVTTILGSCIAVALHDWSRRLGGMNHFLLPRGPRDSDSARFGEVALPRLLNELIALGASRTDLVAKVFGGASVLAPAAVRRDIGRANAEIALAFLAAERIRVVAQHTGGTQGRKLVFRTSDGVVWLKSL